MRACAVWLCREVACVQPRVIIPLGASALKALQLANSVVSFRRKAYSHDEGNVTYFALYHPALVQRSGSLKIPTGVAENLDKLRVLLRVRGILE
jgi:uracil-DNA glycosylase family 4